ncbi:MAG: hypothetical protein DRP70_11550 [Spirochaetes bacterium]|nr:MAG: hypothetical protein DRP70_11550 [Spirochaetota bacterium]RKX97517.1 MAG: hypothetical protein DRZ90_06030 [Spirochaetota bacterium]
MACFFQKTAHFGGIGIRLVKHLGNLCFDNVQFQAVLFFSQAKLFLKLQDVLNLCIGEIEFLQHVLSQGLGGDGQLEVAGLGYSCTGGQADEKNE